MKPLFSLLAALIVAAPLVGADAGSWYETDGTLGPSAVFVNQFDWYRFNAEAGDIITATLSWDPSQGSARMGLSFYGPDGCAFECSLEEVIDEPTSAYCSNDVGDRSSSILTGSPHTITYVAPRDASTSLTVAGGLITDHLDYHLHLQVNGAAPTMGRTSTGYITVSPDGNIICDKFG